MINNRVVNLLSNRCRIVGFLGSQTVVEPTIPQKLRQCLLYSNFFFFFFYNLLQPIVEAILSTIITMCSNLLV